MATARKRHSLCVVIPALTLPLFVSESGENVEQLWKYNFYNFKLHLCMSAHV